MYRDLTGASARQMPSQNRYERERARAHTHTHTSEQGREGGGERESERKRDTDCVREEGVRGCENSSNRIVQDRDL